MPPSSLTLRAGPAALALLRARGLRADDVQVVAAASGGAKWLGIAGLDRYLFGTFLQAPRVQPMHLIASSIGSWRMACFAQRDPDAALARGHHAYVYEQVYTPRPTAREISDVTTQVLDTMLGPAGVEDILSHPWARLHIITAECRGLMNSDQRVLLTAGVLVAAAGNAINRRTLAWQMRRFVFHSAGDTTPFAHLADLPTTHRMLTRDNLRAALMASGAIPLLMEGVRIPGEGSRLHRDGGVLDYHPDLDFGVRDGLVLYPHYYAHVVPGWFDKGLPWRRAPVRNFSHTLLIAPSDAFVASLPGGRIPDRRDFYGMTRDERIRRWEIAMDASQRLADELRELVERGTIADGVKPWEP